MKGQTRAAAGLALVLATVARGAEPPPLLLSDGRAFVQAKQRIANGDKGLAAALKSLRNQAEKELKSGPYSVVNKATVPFGASKHDYVSQAPYFWPNPDTKDGQPYIRRDGKTNPEKDQFDKPQLARMAEAVRTLGLAYFLTDDERYAAHAAKLVRVWFSDTDTRMNPNFTHAQFIPGQNTGRGTGLIEARSFVSVLEGVALFDGSPRTATDRDALRDWYKAFLTWMRTSPEGKKESEATNNHGTWYDVELTAFAVFTGDRALARQTVEAAKVKRIARQIEPDGSMPRELARTKSLDYTLFNVQALFHLATLGDRVGVDLWRYQTDDGRSLRKALDYVLPYTTGGQSWPRQQIAKPHLGSLRTLLRRAAVVYGERSYLDLLPKLADHSDPPIDLLLYPRD